MDKQNTYKNRKRLLFSPNSTVNARDHGFIVMEICIIMSHFQQSVESQK